MHHIMYHLANSSRILVQTVYLFTNATITIYTLQTSFYYTLFEEKFLHNKSLQVIWKEFYEYNYAPPPSVYP